MIQITYQKRTKLSGVYCIKNNINDKIYIGSSQHIMSRIFGGSSTSHIKALKENHHHNYHLQNAWNKYEEKSFSFFILELCDKSILMNRENYYLNNLLRVGELPNNKYFYRKGYNLCPTSETVSGKKHRIETKQHLSNIRKGKNNPMWGRRGETSPYSIPVLQYNKLGNFIKEWLSIRTVFETIGIKIEHIANSIQKNKKGQIKYSAGGYYWIQKTEDSIKTNIIIYNVIRKDIHVELFDIYSGEIYKFSNVTECRKFTKSMYSTIKNCYFNNRIMAKKYKVIKYGRLH